MVEIKRGRGRPAAKTDFVVVGLNLEESVVEKMKAQAVALGYVHKQTGKPNLSAYANALIKTGAAIYEVATEAE